MEHNRIKRFNENSELNISDVMSSENTWLMNWKVIDLLELCSKIAGDTDLEQHPVYKEWTYQVRVRGNGNDSGNLEWVGNKNTPIINNFLLSNGFKEGEQVIFYLSW